MKRPSLGVIPFRADRRPRLALPMASNSGVPVAQISVLPEFEFARPFRREKWNELESFAPGILIGYGFDLQQLAQNVRNAEIQFTVNRAIFVLTDCGSVLLGGSLRESLWRTFSVPVYELIVAPGCKLLASECEVHDGWHLQPGASACVVQGELVYDLPPLSNLPTGFTGDIEAAACACGRPTNRLKNLSPCLPRPYERRLAAIA